MTIGQFSGGVAKLQGAIEYLERAWREAKQNWDDETSRNLEESHIKPIIQQLNEIIEATVPLSETMGQARRGCGPPEGAR
jgi:hypothetical protein